MSVPPQQFGEKVNLKPDTWAPDWSGFHISALVKEYSRSGTKNENASERVETFGVDSVGIVPTALHGLKTLKL